MLMMMLINVDDGGDDDDEDGDGDDGDDDGDERKIMMLMWRTEKMMRLRRMIFRRKTDPKTGKHTLCEPARAICTWTFHKSHFVSTCTGKMTGDTSGDIVLCEPARSKCTWTFHKSHFVWSMEMYGKNGWGHLRGHRFAGACGVETHGHFTRAILCGNLRGKCRPPRIPPRLNTGP
jgi:hypothetical protein